ncbi:MAG: PAS domain S-box protein [Desulfobacteraceae bacterium]|jgi:PAS domain S-box-containing protein
MQPMSHTQNLPQPIKMLRGANVGIIGGGDFCWKIIDFFRFKDLSGEKPNIIGVADINAGAKGLNLARQLDIFTTTDYTQLYSREGLEIILEITHDADLAAKIAKTMPSHVKLVDHFHARYLWDLLQIENIRHRILNEFHLKKESPQEVENLFEQSFDCFDGIINRRNDRFREIEIELLENERLRSQIIQGSTIPTFVINKDHIVTHWNRALEKLSGKPAMAVVGTNRQWSPFWQNERPTMADVILDQIDKNEIEKLYGTQWRESALIEGAYEAEVFFPRVGEHGKWLWFTAAPIKAPDGAIVGAIETLWDKTEDKKAEEDRERHTRELAALCSIYTALSASWDIDQRIEAAIREIHTYLMADDINVYLQDSGDTFYLKYHYGQHPAPAPRGQTDVHKAFIRKVAQKGELMMMEDLGSNATPDADFLARQGFQAVAFIPISAKEKKAIGVVQIASRQPEFAPIERHALDLIGNRMAVAIENALLQQQYIKSEEKYRSLFNNDPNPIFIIDPASLEIIDINERARECYGYSRKDIRGMPFLRLGEPDDREVEYGFKHLPLGQSILLAKRRHFRKNGRSFYVNISVSHARYGEGEVLIATTTDVTESIEKETQLIQASKMTTLGLMAAGMAHEINQPLNVIQIYADFFLKMLKKGQAIPNEDLKRMANDIIGNVDRATGIIKHVRHFARQSEVVASKVNINAPIEDVFKVLGHQIKAHQIELDLKLDPDIPYIMADHNRLEQVFINLVTNAIDAMDEKAEQPEHAGMSKVLQINTYSEGTTVAAAVKDNGVGMRKAVKNKLFEPFFTTKKIGKGTGLGVSISYGIIKDYNGTIDIDSEAGQGTTFTLSFPAVSKEA